MSKDIPGGAAPHEVRGGGSESWRDATEEVATYSKEGPCVSRPTY